jgi:hypothetical protein
MWTPLYKPIGMLVSVAGGIAANAVFRRVWKRVTGDEQAPYATDRDHTWREVLLAAAAQGVIFGVVKAAIDRGGATGFSKITGAWPGDTTTAHRGPRPAGGGDRTERH